MPKRKTNLNQLRILSVVLKETNLSRAADLLGISQPTLSSALNKLREEFNDPLLVRAGNRMKLTAKAKALERPLNNIFGAVDALWEVETPDPKESSRHVLIGSTDYGASMTAAPLYNRLSKEAPGITVQFVDTAETKEMINKENQFDFYLVPDLICYSPAFQDFKYIPLFKDEMVYVVGNHHRLATLEQTAEEDLHEERFVLYHVGMEPYSMEAGKVLANMEKDRNIVMRVQQFSILPAIAAHTDAVVILPRRMAEILVDQQDCTILGPISPAFSFVFCLMWERLYHSDEIHRFLREIFKSEFR